MMNTVALAVALVAGTNAYAVTPLAFRDDTCCSVTFQTGGDVSFPVGEDSEGEILGGSKLDKVTLCYNGDTLTDQQGRPCWFTPPTYVLQCDENATPSTGFTIDCNGLVSYEGSSSLYECPNGIDDEVNIYSKPDEGSNCGTITLTADGCHAACPTTTSAAPSPTCPAPETVTVTPAAQTVTVTPAAQTVTVTATATVSSCPSQSTCPMDLPSGYEFPHLIVPVDSSSPDTAAGTSYFGEASSTISTIFNFDIPTSDSGKQCTLWFLFPEQSQLQTSSYTFSGSGDVDFSSLSSVATQDTTYSNAPSVASDLGSFTVAPGNAYKISTFSCPSGQTVSYEMTAKDSTSLKWFQDYNPCPIGLYVVPS